MKLHILNPLYGGAMSARDESGAASAVPFALPGEEVEIGGEEGGLRILRSGGARVEPRCIHFGVCGGCHYQHTDYAEQLRWKQQILRDELSAAGVDSPATIEVHVGEPWGYRNRIRLRVEHLEGVVRVGYNGRAEPGQRPEFVAIRMCPIAAPLLWRAAEALMRLAAADSLGRRWMQSAVELEFFTNGHESKLQMVLFTRSRPGAGFADFCERVARDLPELAGAGLAVLPTATGDRGRRAERAREVASWGAAGMVYEVAGERMWVSRGGFFQVNRFMVEKLVDLVTKGRAGTLAWDLYAGVGLFSRVLARGFERVVAVEAGDAAASDLAQGLKGKGMVALQMTAAEFLRQAVVQRERPELVVMDPPRAGLGAEVCGLLARVAPARMVYVSCDPVTLSRDLRAMVDSGYAVDEVRLVDMFPQTFHIETVAFLRRLAIPSRR